MAKPIHALLAAARAGAQLRQVDIAAAIGVTPPAISLIESGQRSTTTERVDKWMETCGAELLLAQSDDKLLQALVGEMNAQDLALSLRLCGLLPQLSPDNRRTLEVLLSEWGRAASG